MVSVRPAPTRPEKPSNLALVGSKLTSFTAPGLRWRTSSTFLPRSTVSRGELVGNLSAHHVGDDLLHGEVGEFTSVM